MSDYQENKNNRILKRAVKKLEIRFPVAEISRKTGESQGNISNFLKGKKPVSDNFITSFLNSYNLDKIELEENVVQEVIIDTGAGLIENKNGNSFVELGNGLFLMTIPLLEIDAQAGFSDNFQNTEFLSSIDDYHSIITNEVHRGKYIAFRVKGDSMDNGLSNSILPNSIVSCRELQRVHWKDKLRYKRFPYWVISTAESSYPLLKEITDHDPKKGTITCHSLNDGPEYNDFELDLNTITGLFYVIDVNRSISNKIY